MAIRHSCQGRVRRTHEAATGDMSTESTTNTVKEQTVRFQLVTTNHLEPTSVSSCTTMSLAMAAKDGAGASPTVLQVDLSTMVPRERVSAAARRMPCDEPDASMHTSNFCSAATESMTSDKGSKRQMPCDEPDAHVEVLQHSNISMSCSADTDECHLTRIRDCSSSTTATLTTC